MSWGPPEETPNCPVCNIPFKEDDEKTTAGWLPGSDMSEVIHLACKGAWEKKHYPNGRKGYE